MAVKRGRQKIEIKKIENVSQKSVAFSKRRSGLYKKASELCTLTGGEFALLVQSPGKKFFSLSHPSMEAVIQRYQNRRPRQANINQTENLAEPLQNMKVSDLNAQLAALSMELEKEKIKTNTISHDLRDYPIHNWCRPVAALDNEELAEEIKELECMMAGISIAMEQKKNGYMMLQGDAHVLLQKDAQIMQHNVAVSVVGEFGGDEIPYYMRKSNVGSSNNVREMDPYFTMFPTASFTD